MEVGSVVNTNHHEGQILSGGNYNEIKILAHFSCTCIPEEWVLMNIFTNIVLISILPIYPVTVKRDPQSGEKYQ